LCEALHPIFERAHLLEDMNVPRACYTARGHRFARRVGFSPKFLLLLTGAFLLTAVGQAGP